MNRVAEVVMFTRLGLKSVDTSTEYQSVSSAPRRGSHWIVTVDWPIPPVILPCLKFRGWSAWRSGMARNTFAPVTFLTSTHISLNQFQYHRAHLCTKGCTKRIRWNNGACIYRFTAITPYPPIHKSKRLTHSSLRSWFYPINMTKTPQDRPHPLTSINEYLARVTRKHPT
jgi:hypothetical protein